MTVIRVASPAAIIAAAAADKPVVVVRGMAPKVRAPPLAD
jgi:hypothetical protein